MGETLKLSVIAFDNVDIESGVAVGIVFILDLYREVDFAAFELSGYLTANVHFQLFVYLGNASGKVELLAVERLDFDSDFSVWKFDNGFAESGHGIYHICEIISANLIHIPRIHKRAWENSDSNSDLLFGKTSSAGFPADDVLKMSGSPFLL